MLTATAWGTEGPERQEVAEPAKPRVEAETRCISGHTQKPATSGYAPTPATSRYIPTHATSGCWSGGKREARREAGLNPLPRPVWPRAGLDAEWVQFPVVDVSSWTRGEPEPGGDEAKLWLSAPDAFPLGVR
jgi:hypothetical protein